MSKKTVQRETPDVSPLPDLPHGWTWSSIKALASPEPFSITDGPFGSNLKSEHYTESGPRVVRLQNIGDGTFIDAKAHISEGHFEKLKKHQIFSGDIVIAALGETLPRACLIPPSLGPAIVKADCIRFRPRQDIVGPYLNYALNSHPVRTRTKRIVHGVGRPRLNLSEIKSISLPIAPITLQVGIVSEIEKHFSRLDSALASLKRVQVELKRYRASVLAAACSGRLVPTEAELARKKKRDYEPALELLKRILHERRSRWEADYLAKQKTLPKDDAWKKKYKEPFAPDTSELPELPEGWCWATVAQLGDIQLGRQRSPKNRSKHHPTKYVRAANITVQGLALDDVLDMEFTPAELERYRLGNGDIILSEASGSASQVGKPAIWRDEIPDCCFQNTVIRFRPFRLKSGYPFLLFLHFYVNGIFSKVAGGVGINHLGADKFSAIPFPLPPMSEQVRIVPEVERLLSIQVEVQDVINKKIVHSAALRQSILRHAFTGRLVQ